MGSVSILRHFHPPALPDIVIDGLIYSLHRIRRLDQSLKPGMTFPRVASRLSLASINNRCGNPKFVPTAGAPPGRTATSTYDILPLESGNSFGRYGVSTRTLHKSSLDACHLAETRLDLKISGQVRLTSSRRNRCLVYHFAGLDRPPRVGHVSTLRQGICEKVGFRLSGVQEDVRSVLISAGVLSR